MNTKLIVGAAALMLALAATPAMAYSQDRSAQAPGSITELITGRGAGLAACERLSDDAGASASSPIYCEGSGFSAIFSDVGCSADFAPAANPAVFFGNNVADNAAGCWDDLLSGTAVDTGSDSDGKDDYVHATVTVAFDPSGSAGTINALVGNDRDDDGSTTTDDTDGSNDPTDENGADAGTSCTTWPVAEDDAARDGCYDDEFAEKTGVVDATNSLSISVCFTRDRAEGAGDDWDSIAVFLGFNVPFIPGSDPSPYAGQTKVTLNGNSNGTDCTSDGGRSGHAAGDKTRPTGGQPTGTGATDTVFGLLDMVLGLIPSAPGGAMVLIDVAGAAGVILDGTDMACDYASPVVTGPVGTVTCAINDPAKNDCGLVAVAILGSVVSACDGTGADASASGPLGVDNDGDARANSTEFSCSASVGAPVTIVACGVTFS